MTEEVYETIIYIDDNYSLDMPLLIHIAQHGSYPLDTANSKSYKGIIKKAKITLTSKIEYLGE